MRVLTAMESSGVGALSGIVEVLLQQPSVSVKNAIQSSEKEMRTVGGGCWRRALARNRQSAPRPARSCQNLRIKFLQDKQPISLNPRVLYRGVGVNAASMAPISAIQFGVNSALEANMRGPLSAADKAGVAMVAGAMSAVVSSPSELLMIQQQKSGLSLGRQLRQLTQQHGLFSLTRGFIPTVVREAIFTGTYLGVNPLLQESFLASGNSIIKQQPLIAMLLAACISGTAAATITQPLDTIKTRMQANMHKISYRKVTSAAKTMVQEGGIRALYSGLLPRTQRIIFAVFIMGNAKIHLTSLYLKYLGE